MAIDGYIINLNLTEAKELLSLMKRTAANINQIAKRINASGNVYADDIAEIQNRQDDIWELLNKILAKLSAIS